MVFSKNEATRYQMLCEAKLKEICLHKSHIKLKQNYGTRNLAETYLPIDLGKMQESSMSSWIQAQWSVYFVQSYMLVTLSIKCMIKPPCRIF